MIRLWDSKKEPKCFIKVEECDNAIELRIVDREGQYVKDCNILRLDSEGIHAYLSVNQQAAKSLGIPLLFGDGCVVIGGRIINGYVGK